MKLKMMQLAILVAVISGSVTVNAETVERNEIKLGAGVSAEVSNLLQDVDKKEINLGAGVTNLLQNVVLGTAKDIEDTLRLESKEVVVVKSSLEEIKETNDIEEENKELEEVNKKEEKELKKLPSVNVEINEISKEVYSNEGVFIKDMPTIEGGDLNKLEEGVKLEVTGEVGEWYRVKYKEGDGFIGKDNCTDTKVIKLESEDKNESENGISVKASDYKWNGKKLTKQAGVVKGPSGKETYYNLNMSGVVSRLKRMGYKGNYWVREDGVKMYGDYILVAASFDIRPIGTILPTSLGMGIVADTGGFAKHNKYQLDIATAW